jgi:RHS repeat-associated protein
VYYLHAGRLQEVRCATDRRGRVVWNADYRAFGKAILSVHEIEQPWRYAGHYLERETGLHYAVARYYAPALGRYLSRDPLLVEGGSLNFYTYCDGDPLNRIDPTGEIGAILTAVVIGAVVGAVVGVAIGAGVEMYRQRNEKNFDWGKIGKSALIGGAIGLIGGALGAGLEAAMVATAGVLAAGAIAGGVGAGVEYCLEVAFTDAEWSWEDLRTSVVIGVGVGAVTAGIGGIIAARAARRAAREAAKELAEQAAKEAAERAAKEAAEQAAKEAAEQAAKEGAEQAAKEAAERAAKEAARQTLADEVAEEARRVINSGASKNALRRGAAVSKATLGEYSSRIYQNIYVKITKCPGAVLDEAEGVLRITDVDAYIGEVRRLYAEAGNELNPIIEQRIRAQIANNPALDPTRGLPGLHAEVQAANDVLNQAGEDAALDAVDVATSKITPMEGQGGAFPACENCSGILDSSHIVTGSAE